MASDDLCVVAMWLKSGIVLAGTSLRSSYRWPGVVLSAGQRPKAQEFQGDGFPGMADGRARPGYKPLDGLRGPGSGPRPGPRSPP